MQSPAQEIDHKQIMIDYFRSLGEVRTHTKRALHSIMRKPFRDTLTVNEVWAIRADIAKQLQPKVNRHLSDDDYTMDKDDQLVAQICGLSIHEMTRTTFCKHRSTEPLGSATIICTPTGYVVCPTGGNWTPSKANYKDLVYRRRLGLGGDKIPRWPTSKIVRSGRKAVEKPALAAQQDVEQALAAHVIQINTNTSSPWQNVMCSWLSTNYPNTKPHA